MALAREPVAVLVLKSPLALAELPTAVLLKAVLSKKLPPAALAFSPTAVPPWAATELAPIAIELVPVALAEVPSAIASIPAALARLPPAKERLPDAALLLPIATELLPVILF